jgi:hypothetical protein
MLNEGTKAGAAGLSLEVILEVILEKGLGNG